jgi:hypothetical protein
MIGAVKALFIDETTKRVCLIAGATKDNEIH